MSQYCTGGSQETAERRQGDAGVPHPPLQTAGRDTERSHTEGVCRVLVENTHEL